MNPSIPELKSDVGRWRCMIMCGLFNNELTFEDRKFYLGELGTVEVGLNSAKPELFIIGAEALLDELLSKVGVRS